MPVNKRELNHTKTTKEPKPKRPRLIWINILLIFVVMCVCFIGSAGMAGSSLLSSGLFPAGTIINGVDIGGLSFETGKTLVEADCQMRLERMQITLSYAGESIHLSAEALGFAYDAEAVLETMAYSVGETSSSFLSGLGAVFQPKPSLHAQTSLVFDQKAIAAALKKALRPYERPAVDAQAVFDPDTATFSYTDGVPGRTAALEETVESIIAAFGKSCDPQQVLIVPYDILPVAVPQSVLRENTMLIGASDTAVEADALYIDALQAYCDALNGCAVPPGDTLSVQACVRAHAANEAGLGLDAPGIHTTDTQNDALSRLSGTFYHAALQVGMGVVERTSSVYAVPYLPVGQDAAVDLHGADLKLQNTSDYTLYVRAQLDKASETLTIQLFGQPLKEGEQIEIVSEVISEFPAAQGQQTNYTPLLPIGVRSVVRHAQPGYEVNVYRELYFDGELQNRELLSHDVYQARPALVYIGTGEAARMK
ncbi:MAG: VanW family protein [Christensenellales bacterium]|jgi:vancomycin resistance protein YoaR